MNPQPGSEILSMVYEAISSKKFVAMAATLGITWSEVGSFAKDPHVVIAIVMASAMVVSAYIFAQAAVDAVKELKKP